MAGTLGRGIALGLALLIGLHLAVPVSVIWLIDVRPLPRWVGLMILVAGMAALVALGLCPKLSRRRWGGIVGLLTPLGGALLVNTIQFYALDTLHRKPWFPMTAIMLLLIVGSLLGLRRAASGGRWRRGLGIAGVAGLVLVVAPLAQMFLFGKTDYRRPADAIVVFGARVYADGRLSDALRDRVETACALYHAGYAPWLIVSGGPGDGEVHETHAMRDFAIRAGVPAEAILVDARGLSTAATVEQTLPLLAAHDLHQVLAVSHFYHLPRVKLAYQRRGVEVYTVPADERYTLTKIPLLMLREVAATWVYLLRPVG